MSSKSTAIIASTAAVLILAVSVFVMPMQSAKSLVLARTLVFPLELKNGIIGKNYNIGIHVVDRQSGGASANYIVHLTATSKDTRFTARETAPLVFIPGSGAVFGVLAPDVDDSGLHADVDCDCAGANIHVVSSNAFLTYTYSLAVLNTN
jgi:hypothetical protein